MSAPESRVVSVSIEVGSRPADACLTRLCRSAGVESSGNRRHICNLVVLASLLHRVPEVCANISCNCFKHSEKQSRTVLTLFSRVRYQSAPIVLAGLAATWLPHIPFLNPPDTHFKAF